MCLSSLNLALEWDEKEQDYVGYGYKRVHSSNYQRNRGKILEQPLYEKANAKFGSFSEMKTGIEISERTKKRYIPGFHIFLDQKSAENYKYGGDVIIKVKYKEVLAFGKNEAGELGNKNCVIALYMKVLGEV